MNGGRIMWEYAIMVIAGVDIALPLELACGADDGVVYATHEFNHAEAFSAEEMQALFRLKAYQNIRDGLLTMAACTAQLRSN